MRILFTGASSFTGYWFVRALSEVGCEVVAPITNSIGAYSDPLRKSRIEGVGHFARVVECAPFGSKPFIDLLDENFDILCHHGAFVRDYRSPDFDIILAISNNTLNIREVARKASDRGVSALVVTGSVFENREGSGTLPLRAFSPYGLSKAVTADICEFHAHTSGLRYGKFVIANPFGPYEDPRFGSYLMRTWLGGGVARVNTPMYVRDNIHVDLLALEYAAFCLDLAQGGNRTRAAPSGYAEQQGAFASRFASEVRLRTGLECHLELATQTDFNEPLVRINTDPAVSRHVKWDASAAWDAVVEFYARRTETH